MMMTNKYRDLVTSTNIKPMWTYKVSDLDSYQFPRIWTFGNGGGLYPRVTVRALTYADADMRARNTLDKRYEKAGKEPPVSWTLILIGVRLPAKKKKS